jgi:outer membrane protein TolC
MEPQRLISAALAALFLLSAGCTVGPDYIRPATETPDAYKEMAGWKVAQPKDDVIRGAWWEILNDPQLSALEKLVNISNQNIVAAEAQFRQARALVQATRSAYFPTVTAGPSVSRSRSSSNIGAGPITLAGNFSDYLLTGNASWELDIWGKIRRTVEASKAGAQASAADVEAARLSAQAELAQDYFALRTLDAQKQLLDQTVIAYWKFLELTRNR